MINVLQYIPGFSYGGIETFMLDINKELKEQCQFTYIVEKDIDCKTKKIILEDCNAKIIRIPNMTKEGVWKHIIAINKILKMNKYDIVHIHASDARIFLTIIAKFYNVKKIIYHVHTIKPLKENILKKIIRVINMKLSDILMACSREAAESMFGNKAKKAAIINTGIDIKKFEFSQKKREYIRKSLKIKQDEILIGTVGRVEKVKNQIFLLKIIKCMCASTDKVKLLIVGSGSEEKNLKEYVKNNNLNDRVIFLGKTDEVYSYYSAMDIFCFPSLYEGFGIALLEAQANGLNCLASTNVPIETNVTGNVSYIEIEDKDLHIWKDKIFELALYRNENIRNINNKGYDIKDNAKMLLKVYKE